MVKKKISTATNEAERHTLDENKNDSKDKILFTLKFLLLLSVASFILSLFFTSSSINTGNVAVIPINGEIVVGNVNNFYDDYASSDTIISLIDEADSNPNVKAIIFEINSPGGSPVASDEIASRIKKLNKTNVALIREIGTSGAYWVASSTDRVFANRMSITGSIGVIGSYIEFSGLMERFNVTYQRLVSGKYKDIGSPYKEMTAEEEKVMQDLVNKLNAYFIDEVSQNRNLSRENVVKLAETGMFYLGVEAKSYGLIDELGNKDDVTKYLEAKLNTKVSLINYEEKKSFWDIVASMFSKKSFLVEQNGVSFR
jgi:protease IV